MPYGSISEPTHRLLEERAKQANIPLEKIGINPDMPSIPDRIPETLVEITIIIEGALDEEFYLNTIYGVNVVDWIVEELKAETETPKPSFSNWEVILSSVVCEDAGETLYRQSSWDGVGD